MYESNISHRSHCPLPKISPTSLQRHRRTASTLLPSKSLLVRFVNSTLYVGLDMVLLLRLGLLLQGQEKSSTGDSNANKARRKPI